MPLELKEQYEKIYTYCYFKVRNREAAEDMTQETFLKYFATTKYLEKGKKLAFLYTIARNCCIDYYRTAKQTEDIGSLSGSAEEMEGRMETVLAVGAAVSKLSGEEQEIVLLRYANELGIQEIAEHLGVSRFTVYRKLQGIEKQLKKTLRKEDFHG